MSDRNFDDIAEHFATKVYGGLKGRIRLAVLCRDLDACLPKKSLRVLDIGAGMGQVGLYLASLGHDVVLCDVSCAMLDKAKQAHEMQSNHTWGRVRFLHTPYQSLMDTLKAHKIAPVFDVILCHAVLEWVANPKELVALCRSLLAVDGILSLCFYNPASVVYRNLVLGNFYFLQNPKKSDHNSLTPNNPVDCHQVQSWFVMDAMLCQSGIRVFYDYATKKQGGLLYDDDVIAMELHYSQRLPFLYMGRYLHFLVQLK